MSLFRKHFVAICGLLILTLGAIGGYRLVQAFTGDVLVEVSVNWSADVPKVTSFAAGVVNNTIQLNWAVEFTPIDEFLIYVRQEGQATYGTPVSVASTSRSYVFPNPSTNTSYEFMLRVVSSGNEYGGGVVLVTTPASFTEPPATGGGSTGGTTTTPPGGGGGGGAGGPITSPVTNNNNNNNNTDSNTDNNTSNPTDNNSGTETNNNNNSPENNTNTDSDQNANTGETNTSTENDSVPRTPIDNNAEDQTTGSVVNSGGSSSENEGTTRSITTDSDNDGVPDSIDNCPYVPNPSQQDADSNGVGDSCQNDGQISQQYEEQIDPLRRDDMLALEQEGIDSDNDGLLDAWEEHYFGDLGSTDGSVDSDGDGLTDQEEHDVYTDPTKQDTDNDGLSDFDEVRLIGTDPNNFDSDGDRMSDAEELKYGTDPWKKDTDGDGYWDLMEIAAGTDPLDKNSIPVDENQDGVDDNWVKKFFPDGIPAGTSLGVLDSDGDGLSDKLEYYYNTDPTNPDTDNDGYFDGEEVFDDGTDPRNPLDNRDTVPMKITNWRSGDRSASNQPMIRGIAVKGAVSVRIFLVGDFGTYEISDVVIDPDRRFYGLAPELNDGYYNVIAVGYDANGNVIGESAPVRILIDQSIDIKAPDPRRLGEANVSPDVLLKNITIEIKDRIPTVRGEVYYGSTVVAAFHSVVYTSALVADNEKGTFEISAPRPLELGPHEVFLYAENYELGAKSDTIRIPFVITDEPAVIHGSATNPWWSTLGWIIGLLVLLGVLVAGGWFWLLPLWKRRKKEKEDDGDQSGSQGSIQVPTPTPQPPTSQGQPSVSAPGEQSAPPTPHAPEDNSGMNVI